MLFVKITSITCSSPFPYIIYDENCLSHKRVSQQYFPFPYFIWDIIGLRWRYLSPCIRCEPHLEQAKHFMWKTCRGCWGALVLITNSLAGIAWPQAAHAPLEPNILEQCGTGCQTAEIISSSFCYYKNSYNPMTP